MSDFVHILVVDDNKSIRDSLAKILRKEGYSVALAKDGEAALEYLASNRVKLVLTDLRMPRVDGFGLLCEAHNRHPDVALVLMTAHGGVDIAMEALREGAHGYIEKPLRRAEVVAVVTRALLRHFLARQTSTELYPQPHCPAELIGSSKAVRDLLAQLQFVAESTTPVLLEGEEGTDIGSVAYAIHCLSPNWRGRFYRLGVSAEDICTLTELMNGEFEAIEPGGEMSALTKDTVFVDGLRQLPPDQQYRLWEFLRSPSIDLPTAPRLLFAAGGDEADGAEAETELLECVSQLRLSIPALREHSEDIPLLIGHFLRLHSDRLNKNIQRVSDQVLDALLEYRWLGNARELEDDLRHAVLSCQEGVIQLRDLPTHLQAIGSAPRSSDQATASHLENIGRQVVFQTLRRTGDREQELASSKT